MANKRNYVKNYDSEEIHVIIDTEEKNRFITLKDLLEETKKEDIKMIFPSLNKKRVSEEAIVKLIESLASNLGVSRSRIFIAMILLFIKGAANSSAPDTLAVQIGKDGVSLTKGKLKDHCKTTCEHTYIRRIAESMAEYIGKFAFENKMKGDLYKIINNKCLSHYKRELTDKEAAFASSFTRDGIKNINEMAESSILAQLLAEDYQERSAIYAKKDKNLPYQNKGREY
jgi:hypothetical protein